MTVQRPPLNIPFFDKINNLAREWALFFEGIHKGDAGSSWTPTYSGLTTAGSVTHTGYYYRLSNNLIYFRAKIVTSGGGTTASTAGTTYISNFPPVINYDGACQATRISGNIAIGGGAVISTNSRIYLPTWVATSDSIVISGTVEAR